MILGGLAMSLIGFSLGEASLITPEKFTLPAVYAYFHLLLFGSLIGFLAYLWLLDHVSAALAGTYAYINPVIAVCLGCAIAHETLTWPMLAGMLIILSSVALVRAGVVHGDQNRRPATTPPVSSCLSPDPAHNRCSSV